MKDKEGLFREKTESRKSNKIIVDVVKVKYQLLPHAVGKTARILQHHYTVLYCKGNFRYFKKSHQLHK